MRSGGTSPFAHLEVGETAALLRDTVNMLENLDWDLWGSHRGALAPATTIALQGRTTRGASWAVDAYPVRVRRTATLALFLQDEDEVIGTAQMPYREQVDGLVGLNYERAPGAAVGCQQGYRQALPQRRPRRPGDAAARGLRGRPGTAPLCPFSEQAHVFSLEGHRWPLEPGRWGTDSSLLQLGGLSAATLHLANGAGGTARAPGDHVYGDHREPYRDAGLGALSGP